jgi:hypothetical protein
VRVVWPCGVGEKYGAAFRRLLSGRGLKSENRTRCIYVRFEEGPSAAAHALKLCPHFLNRRSRAIDMRVTTRPGDVIVVLLCRDVECRTVGPIGVVLAQVVVDERQDSVQH